MSILYVKRGYQTPSLMHAYKKVSILGTDQLACGCLLRNGTLYSPSTYVGSDGVPRSYCAAAWNKMSHIGAASGIASTFGSLVLDSRGPYYWHTPNRYDWLKAYGPSQTTSNITSFLYPNSGEGANTKNCHFHEFEVSSSSAVHSVFEDGTMRGPSPVGDEYAVGYYNENSTSGNYLACIASTVSNFGADNGVLFRVHCELNVKITGDLSYKPSSADFDMSLVAVANTTGTNNTYWVPSTTTLANNVICYKELDNKSSVVNGVDEDGCPVMLFRGATSFYYPCGAGWNPIRFALPALKLGPYSTIPVAPTKTIHVTGFSMVVAAELVIG